MPRSPIKPPKTSSSPYPPSSPTKRLSQSRPSVSMPKSQEPYRFDFGKYNGKTLLEVPPSYITWCINEGVTETRPQLKKAIKSYMQSPPATELAAATSSKPQRTSVTQAIAQREKQLRESMGQWLLDECWMALQVTAPSTDGGQRSVTVTEERKLQKKWLDILEASTTAEFVKQYPPRPQNAEAELPKTSRAANRLRETLASCPVVSSGMIDFPMLSDAERLCVTAEYDQLTGKIIGWSWSNDFIKDVKKCLTAVKRECGDRGLEAAVWEVRDVYSSYVGGITCEKRGMNQSECYVFHDQSVYWFKSLPKRP
ncbi:hypothetical protein E1B28_011680 [Marasmius oreades]|uniref:Exodeoxyribonuclease X-like C-terminal domain-containing protein n=1 Tax=Marasmius oreades TaxID=181124 RepID=A0A9P7UQ76_9AGAR|nr:uncharacterized protein E1B28_011680 [Marasmius oreades]KAG7090063.1 hypothetical protein E1B28_011680 [Marasmius oreades]